MGQDPRGADAGRRYHHGHLREALVDAGLALTRTGGPEALVLRDVTRRVGVSPTAAYRHFADRDSLLAEVARRVHAGVAGAMQDGRPAAEPGPEASPDESLDADEGARAVARLRAVGLGYIGFALAEPGWFAVAFATSALPLPGGHPGTALPTAGAAPFQALVAALDGLVAAGLLDPTQRPGAEWPCWSAVHGFAVLALQGPLHEVPADVRQRAAERTVDAVIAGLLAPPSG